MRRVSPIPIDRLGEVGAGSLGKEDTPHSSLLLDELAVDSFPGDRCLGVVVKGCKAAIKLALLRGS